MSTIFLSSASDDRACADQVRQGLEAAGYSVWRELDYPTPTDSSYPYVIENAILGSAAVVVLWSQGAASFPWVKRHMLFAQRFFKPLLLVKLDEASLPSTMLVDTLSGTEPCGDIVPQLLSRLPAPDSTDSLLMFCELAAHQYNHKRKEAIDRAKEMLQRGEHREEVLAILEYLERNDLLDGVREKARSVLQQATQPNTAPSTTPVHPRDARHLFDVRCQNGHITRFDRRDVCSKRREVMRGLDELVLKCSTCGVKMAVEIDCEGYE